MNLECRDYIRIAGRSQSDQEWVGIIGIVLGTFSAPFLGIPPTGQTLDICGLDFWRLDGDLIRENWVMVDLIHMYEQLGVDVFARMKQVSNIGFQQNYTQALWGRHRPSVKMGASGNCGARSSLNIIWATSPFKSEIVTSASCASRHAKTVPTQFPNVAKP